MYDTTQIGSSRLFDLELTGLAIVVGVSMHVLSRVFTFFYVHLLSYVLLLAVTFFTYI